MSVPHRSTIATRRRTGLAAGACAVVAALTLGLGGGPAAADGPRYRSWSGMDTRNYAGPIPAKAGTVISSVDLDRRLWVPNTARAQRYLYSTQNVHGKKAVSTAAVFVPGGTAPKGGWPVIAWAHGTTGLGDDCSPSTHTRNPRDSAYLAHWLQQGYAIVATDYVGLGTPGLMSYLNGPTEARSTVDSVKAAQHLDLSLGRTWAIVGQSQGAGAALAGARHATSLSAGSGLDYRGVVATGTPANIELIIGLGGPGFPPVTLPAALNAYVAYILAGFTDARPDLDVEGLLTPLGKKVLTQAAELCYGEMADAVDGVDISTMFRKPVSSLPNAQAALTEYMGTPYTGYDRPIFLGQGLRDVDVPAPSALSLYAQMKANNQPVELHVYPSMDHSDTVLASLKDSTPFVSRIMR